MIIIDKRISDKLYFEVSNLGVLTVIAVRQAKIDWLIRQTIDNSRNRWLEVLSESTYRQSENILYSLSNII